MSDIQHPQAQSVGADMFSRLQTEVGRREIAQLLESKLPQAEERAQEGAPEINIHVGDLVRSGKTIDTATHSLTVALEDGRPVFTHEVSLFREHPWGETAADHEPRIVAASDTALGAVESAAAAYHQWRLNRGKDAQLSEVERQTLTELPVPDVSQTIDGGAAAQVQSTTQPELGAEHSAAADAQPSQVAQAELVEDTPEAKTQNRSAGAAREEAHRNATEEAQQRQMTREQPSRQADSQPKAQQKVPEKPTTVVIENTIVAAAPNQDQEASRKGLFSRLLNAVFQRLAALGRAITGETAISQRGSRPADNSLNGLFSNSVQATAANVSQLSDANVANACFPGHPAFEAAVTEMVKRYPGLTLAAQKYANFWGSEKEALHRTVRDLAASAMLVSEQRFPESAAKRLQELLTNGSNVPSLRTDIGPILGAARYADRVLRFDVSTNIPARPPAIAESKEQTAAHTSKTPVKAAVIAPVSEATREQVGNLLEKLQDMRARWVKANPAEHAGLLHETETLVRSIGGRDITGAALRVKAEEFVQGKTDLDNLRARATKHIAATLALPRTQALDRGRGLER